MAQHRSVPAIEKATRLLHLLADQPGRSTAQLGRELGIPPASCYRIVTTLRAAGWIRAAPTGGWQLASGLLPLLAGLQGDRALIDLVRPRLRQLVQSTGISAKCSIRENDQQTILLSENADKPFTVTGTAGIGFPIHLGSSGAALLLDAPDLDQVLASMADESPADSPALLQARQADLREQGWCAKIGVNPQGIDGMSAVVRDRAGRVCCVITLLGLRGDLTPERLPELARALRTCATNCQLAISAYQEEDR